MLNLSLKGSKYMIIGVHTIPWRVGDAVFSLLPLGVSTQNKALSVT